MVEHFVLTRIGLGVTNRVWLESMVDLFSAVTFPSLCAQTNKAFHWLVVADMAMPRPQRERLAAILAERPRSHLVVTDVTQMTHMRLGGHDWIFEPCRQYILENALLTDPFEYIITSTIDADDAWRRDFVATINAACEPRIPDLIAEEQKRGFHLMHSSGVALTFPDGLEWFLHTNATRPWTSPFRSMSVSVCTRFSSGISAFSCRHALWSAQCQILDFGEVRLNTDLPMWVHVRHNRTDMPWNATDLAAADADTIQDLSDSFGVDLDKVASWSRAQDVNASIDRPTTVHAGQKSRQQYARMFRLTALNCQIQALECRALDANGGHAPSSNHVWSELLARQVAIRDDLLREFRRAGETIYS